MPKETAKAPKLPNAGAYAGLSGGTGFAGLLLLLPNGIIKSILIVLAPLLTVAISTSWHFLTEEIDKRVADWRIRHERKRVQLLLSSLEHNPTADEELKRQAESDLRALILLEVEISRKRVEAIVAS